MIAAIVVQIECAKMLRHGVIIVATITLLRSEEHSDSTNEMTGHTEKGLGSVFSFKKKKKKELDEIKICERYSLPETIVLGHVGSNRSSASAAKPN